jgi:hypothetical protein
MDNRRPCSTQQFHYYVSFARVQIYSAFAPSLKCHVDCDWHEQGRDIHVHVWSSIGRKPLQVISLLSMAQPGFCNGGFLAGRPGNRGRARERVREGLSPPAWVRGLGSREHFSDCRCIFVSFNAFF